MDLLSLQPLLIFFFFSISVYFIQNYLKTTPTKPGFKLYPLVGALPDFLLNRHRFLDWTTDVLSRCPTNTATFRRPGKVHGIITANPLIIEHALKTHFENYPKGERFISFLRDFLGQGIFNSDGEVWRIQRKIASYEFSTKSLRNFVLENVTAELQVMRLQNYLNCLLIIPSAVWQERMIPLLKEASETDRVLDLQDVLERFAFDNICKLAFDVDPGCLRGDRTVGAEFMRAFEDATLISAGRFMSVLPILWKIKRFLNVGSEKRLKESIETVHKFAEKIIESKKGEKKDEDLLSRFMGDEDNSPEFLRDIVISFILAGRDTTSSTLSWFFWAISSRPDVEGKILEELHTIRLRNQKSFGDTFTFNELRDMHYLHAAISETLRLYPPVPVDTRSCSKDDTLPDGTFIGGRWFFTYHAYAMGRMESIWGKNCREFLPERWLEENGTYRPENPFRFPVFHSGPRMCLGKDLAYIQMKSIAAAVVERFKIHVENRDKCPVHTLSLTLRMKDGLRVTVEERDN